MAILAVGYSGPPSVLGDICLCERQWDYSRLKSMFSVLYNSVFIETVNLQNVLELPEWLVLFFISIQTNKLKCHFDCIVNF